MHENSESPAANFLEAPTFAVACASRNRSKYGNKVLQALLASGRIVYPLNPSAPEIDGHIATVVACVDKRDCRMRQSPKPVASRTIRRDVDALIAIGYCSVDESDSNATRFSINWPVREVAVVEKVMIPKRQLQK